MYGDPRKSNQRLRAANSLESEKNYEWGREDREKRTMYKRFARNVDPTALREARLDSQMYQRNKTSQKRIVYKVHSING